MIEQETTLSARGQESIVDALEKQRKDFARMLLLARHGTASLKASRFHDRLKG